MVYAARPLRPSLLFSAIVVTAASTSACDGCAKPQVSIADATAPGPTTVPDAAPVNVTPIPTASVAAMVNPQHLPAYAGPTGSVEGTITVTGDPAPETPAEYLKCPDAAKTYGHAFREGAPKEPGGPRWIADAVVAVTGYGDFFVPEKDDAAEVAIEGCAYAKRTVTLTFGQRLEVKNLSKEFWTPVLQPAPTTVMMMATPGGDPVKLYPKKPGRYVLGDHDRKYAGVDLFAFLHPLHTTSDLKGYYRIDGVPVGKVKVNTMHPRIDGVDASVEVHVKPNVVHRVDLTLVHKTPPPPEPAKAAADAGAYYPPVH